MNYALDVLAFSQNSFQNNISSFFGLDNNSTYNGMYYLMELIADKVKVQQFFDAGASFTTPFPSYINLFFGYYFSLIPLLFFALVAAFSASIFYNAIFNNKLFAVFVAKFYILIFTALVMGKVNLFFSHIFLIYFLTIIIIILASSVNKKGKPSKFNFYY
jgi:hypothetical protein